MMKIAFLNIYQNQVDRGAETYVRELASRLGQKHSVDIIVGGRKVPGRWPIFWRTFCDPQGLTIARFTIKNLKRIWKEKYDVVIPTNGGWQPAFVRLITWLYGGKMIISGQSGKGWDDRNNLWCFPDVFIALSSFLKKWAKKTNPFITVKYIPNGVDLKMFKPDGGKMRSGLESPVVLCVGALTEEKRIELTIRAVAKLKNVSLLVVGKGELKDSLEKLGKKLLGGRFRLTSCPHKNMPKVYRSADLFTIGSPWYRSFEIVLVEAMASGLPVVANKDDIRREIVGRAGILVDPTNTNAYAIALENALRLKWGKRPHNQAKKFDWDLIAQKYEKLLNMLVK
jgi:glycosyltransferase involved in cell wall biosynthesis